MPTVYGDVAVPEGGAELFVVKSDFTLILCGRLKILQMECSACHVSQRVFRLFRRPEGLVLLCRQKRQQ